MSQVPLCETCGQSHLTDKERWTAISALRVAAAQYAIDAINTAAIKRLSEKFICQAKEANDLADKLEEEA